MRKSEGLNSNEKLKNFEMTWNQGENASAGCEWEGAPADMQSHLERCMFSIIGELTGGRAVLSIVS